MNNNVFIRHLRWRSYLKLTFFILEKSQRRLSNYRFKRFFGRFINNSSKLLATNYGILFDLGWKTLQPQFSSLLICFFLIMLVFDLISTKVSICMLIVSIYCSSLTVIARIEGSVFAPC